MEVLVLDQIKKIFFTVLFSLGLLETSACGKEAQTNTVPTESLAGENTPLPTSGLTENTTTVTVFPAVTELLTPTLIPTEQVSTPTPKPTEPIPVPTEPTPTKPSVPQTPTSKPIPTSPLNPEISYLGIAVDGGAVTVYISKDPSQPQVAIRKRGENIHSFCWDYNLEYGDPITYIEKDCENMKALGFPDEDEGVLAIWLPTKPLTEKICPDHFQQEPCREICGEGHCFSLTDLSTSAPDTLSDKLFDDSTNVQIYGELTTGYTDGGNVFSLFSGDGEILEQFPMLHFPDNKIYPIVYGEVHVDEYGAVCQRFGIDIIGDILWLGNYSNGRRYLLDKNTLALDTRYGSNLNVWWPRKFAEEGENAWLDLDGDGISEEITYCFVTHEGSYSNDFLVNINGTEHELGFHSELNPVLYTASLDKKGWQILALDYGEGRSEDWVVFQYENGSLHKAGSFLGGSYQKTGNEEENIYISTGFCYPLQRDSFELKQNFSNGILSEITQDYYEFTALYRDAEDETPHRNVITVKRTFDLYSQKNGTETFPLTEGSHVIFLGTDFKEWILVKNIETDEQGWLRVKMEDKSAHDCILMDGSEVAKEVLFEGLMDYD